MSYIEKCIYKTDLLMNKLKPSSNLILFILSKNNYLGYTLSDMKQIMKNSKNHYIENTDTLQTFFYLPNRIVIDSSLQHCFNNKANTMKLIKNKNKFRVGFKNNLTVYEFYSVEKENRIFVDSNEPSFFNDEKQEYIDEENENENEIEID